MIFKNKWLLQISDYSVNPSYFNQLYGDETGYYEFSCCFNIVHEIFHALYKEYSDYNNRDDSAIGQVEEELLANDFAVAFWRLHTDTSFLDRILKKERETKEKGKRLLIDYDENLGKEFLCDDYKYFYRKYAFLEWGRLAFSKVPAERRKHYDYFQTCSIVESFEKRQDFNSILQAMGINGKRNFDCGEKLTYKCDITTPNLVISDIRKIFNNHSVTIPEIQYCVEMDILCNCITPI